MKYSLRMADTSQIVETRRISVQGDQFLEVQMTQQFIDRVKQHFGLFGNQPLDDDQIRMYVWGAFNTAVTNAEQGTDHGNQTAASADRADPPPR